MTQTATTVTTPFIYTAFLHAGKSHYTLRYVTNPTTNKRQGIALLEEQTHPNGSIFVTAYTTPVTVKNRLTAAKRYDLKQCDSLCTDLAPSQANVGASVPPIPAYLSADEQAFDAFCKNVRIRMSREDACNDTDCPNAKGPRHTIGHACYPAINWSNERPDSHTTWCVSNCTPTSNDEETIRERTMPDDRDVCGVPDCIHIKGGDHLTDTTCLAF
jgi:hypothetical protein